MATATQIRSYDYVNHSYTKVRDALTLHSNDVFRRATKAAQTRANSIAAELHVKIAGVEIAKEILVDIKRYIEIERKREQKLTIQLEWKAAETAGLFPVMDAELHVYPISKTETQLDFQGEYQPPLGIVGKAIDAVVGRRIAEASVHHFVVEVADYLRRTISN